MRLLWLSNMAPSPVLQQLGKTSRGGLWMDHVLKDLRCRQDLKLHLLFPLNGGAAGNLDSDCSYAAFEKLAPAVCDPQQEAFFLRQLREFKPDVVHIWGTEFGHTRNMLQACQKEGLLDRTVVSIQGLCSIYARHYNEGIPAEVLKHNTIRDILRHDGLLQQQAAFEKRGENEKEAFRLCRHVIGRTHWDRACARVLNPQAEYHFCNETMRDDFYEGSWSYETCVKHRIFASSCIYPIKGFHYLLEALAEVRKRYPDATLFVPGKNPVAGNFSQKFRQDGYAGYLEKLLKDLNLMDAVTFLGSLSGEKMKENYLKANVFVLPSTIENSPNSLGEAMLLGVPCAAADVGGVTTMLESGREGIVFQGTAPYMLSDAIEKIFSMEEKAESMGKAAADHAKKTHDPDKNLRDLLNIYEEISGGSRI